MPLSDILNSTLGIRWNIEPLRDKIAALPSKFKSFYTADANKFIDDHHDDEAVIQLIGNRWPGAKKS